MPKKFVYTLVALFTFIGLVWLNWPNQTGRAKPEPRLEGAKSGDSRPESAPIITIQESSLESNAANEPTQANRRWLDPIIIRTLNSQTTWNDTGTEKKVVSIVEADFHNPHLRIEETYSVDPYTGKE
ncbi:MAG: hypothetical protein P8L44_00935 [Opitutales bacterium]|jgi:hypothetical protein|nr:hypothetical protein [Opitutales bacterium]